MPLSWNEIRHRSIAFSKEWAGVSSERAEKQTFWNEFFDVFGVNRRAVASFEEPVKNLKGNWSSIDLFWKRTLLVEHKSAGGDLSAAKSQAFEYIQALIREGRLDEVPRYVIVSDFASIALHDLEPEEQINLPLFAGRRVRSYPEFPVAKLHEHIHDFAFIPGYKQHSFEEQDPINIEAVEILGRLHDALESGGYKGHELERFLVRILFCLFAEDTGIFDREAFRLYLENRTAADGSDLGVHLARLFEVLDTPLDRRQENLDEMLKSLPYVNGELFAERLGFADFNAVMRHALLASCQFDWSRISPAIFGSLFQAVMEPGERRQIGGHYTSERDILKLVRSLFLDELRTEFDRAKSNKAELKRLHDKISGLRFLDPACGCGNFLVVTYRELRDLEIQILKLLYPGDQRELDIQRLSHVDVDQFYGIEISEWPARIAEVAMWLMDHQMNIRLSEAFGQYFVRLPLKKSPTIVNKNALRTKWDEVLTKEKCSYVLGNPPFVGKQYATSDQKADVGVVSGSVKGAGVLDYVTMWYFKAGEFIQGTKIKAAFVSTNSITQGEQVGVLWNELFRRYHLKIHFAHRTFAWESEARGKAHVHVVIIGFGAFDIDGKLIFDYELDGNVSVSRVRNISPYLIDSGDIVVLSRTKAICDVPEIIFGSMPNDGGGLTLTDDERKELLLNEPGAAKFVRRLLGAEEFLHGIDRWCLWLADATPSDLLKLPKVLGRVESVKLHREGSSRPTTRELASTPTLFGENRQPQSDYLAIPSISSEKRKYIPIGFLASDVIANNKLLVIPGANSYHFGLLTSEMHMAWMRQVTGRLESRYQYSNKLVYNNFPWPFPTPKQRASVELAAKEVLDVRSQYQNETFANLYDPVAMPPGLVKAHAALDRAVELCYVRSPSTTTASGSSSYLRSTKN